MASKIKGRPSKQPKVAPALPSDDSQQLHENNPGKTPQGEGGGGGEGVGPKSGDQLPNMQEAPSTV